jgi:hypothetical protein
MILAVHQIPYRDELTNFLGHTAFYLSMQFLLSLLKKKREKSAHGTPRLKNQFSRLYTVSDQGFKSLGTLSISWCNFNKAWYLQVCKILAMAWECP